MQAITTKYLGPTNTRPSRIKATSPAGVSVTVPYDYDGSTEDRHKKAAVALCEKLGWTDYGNLIGGGTVDGYVFVFEPRATAALRDALGNLCQHVAGNRGNRDGNPYCKPEMLEALQALHYDQTGRNGVDFDEFANAADIYRKPA